MFSFGQCPKYLSPPLRATCTSFSEVKNDVVRILQKNTNYDSDGCNDDYDGNFDDNDDKKLPNDIQI